VVGSLQPLSRTEPAPAPEPEPPSVGSPRPPRLRLWLLGLAVAALAFGGAVLWKISRTDPGGRLEHAKLVIISGHASPKRAPNGAEERWQNGHVTVTIDDSVDALGPAARQAVESAFGTWLTSGADVPALSFDSAHGTRVSEQPDGKNSVVYAPIDMPGHRNDLALTLTFTDPDTGAILEADLVINSRHHFGVLDAAPPGADQQAQHDDHESEGEHAQSASCGGEHVVACGGRYDLASVATHEVGHFLGLGEDETDNCATMYRATGRCQLNKRVLQSDDQSAMKELYAGGFADGASASSGCSATPDPAGGSAPALLGLVIALGAALRRRPG
jgi:MYXO-CTERM domain-containing protein